MITRSIPSLFTTGNLLLGILAILLAIDDPEYIHYAAILIIIGMILDAIDGRVARMLNATTDFGKELDSLSDIVSFGVAPAVIMYMVALEGLGIWGMLITALFPICGALRLARFSLESSGSSFFQGLPITIAGGVLATLALYHNILPDIFLPIGMLVLSILMVSNVEYPNFKKVAAPRALFWFTPLMIALVALLATRYPTEFPKIVFVLLFLYAAYGVKNSVETYVRKKRRMRRQRRAER